MNETRYMISDASKKLHVEAHVLRYWEDELEMEIPRTELGHRYYTSQHLLTFERIKQLKEAGYQLKAIKLIMPKLAQLDAEEFEFILLVADEMNRMAIELSGETPAEAAAAKNEPPSKTGASKGSPSAKGTENAEDAANAEPSSSVRTTAAPKTDAEQFQSDNREQNGREQGRRAKGRQTDTAMDAETLSEQPREEDSAQDRAEGGTQDRAEGGTQGRAADSFDSRKEANGQNPADAQLPSNVIPMNRMPSELTHEEKLQQFQNVMTSAVSNAMQLQARQFGALLSDQVSAKLLTEINYLLRLRQEEEELHFQQLDETIRSHQKAMQEAAAGRAPGRRKRRK